MVNIAPKTIHCLFLHGIGSQDAGYSNASRDILQTACGLRGTKLYSKEVLYSSIFGVEAEKYFKSVTSKGASGNLIQKFSIFTLADALQWVTNSVDRAKVLAKIDEAYTALRAPGEVVIFAHSLGGVAAVEWLNTRQAVKNVRLCTFGSNINLFHLGQQLHCPPQVSSAGKWINFWDKHDGIGFMLATRPELAHVKDIEVSVGQILGATGAAHIAFFNDFNFWNSTIPDYLNV